MINLQSIFLYLKLKLIPTKMYTNLIISYFHVIIYRHNEETTNIILRTATLTDKR